MTTYQVQAWPNGQWDGKPYQPIDASTPQEAAEKLCGAPLKLTGPRHQIRARVRDGFGQRQGRETIFYEG